MARVEIVPSTRIVRVSTAYSNSVRDAVPKEIVKLSKLLDEERRLVSRARLATIARDRNCMMLERRYGLSGWTWRANLDAGIIELLERRSDESALHMARKL